MMGGMNNMLKQAQQMQKKMEQIQAELSSKIYEASSGGDSVKVTMNGKMELESLKIQKSVVDPGDVEMLEDLVLSAVRSVIKQAQDDQQNSLSGLTGGLKIPGLF